MKYVIPISCLVRAGSVAEATAQKNAALALLGAPFIPGLAQTQGVPLDSFQVGTPEAYEGFWNIPLYAFVSLTMDREGPAMKAKLEQLLREPAVVAMLRSKRVDVATFTVGDAQRMPAAANAR